MKDLSDTNISQKHAVVSASILDDFELLRNPKDDTKLTGGAKILSSLKGDEVRKTLKLYFPFFLCYLYIKPPLIYKKYRYHLCVFQSDKSLQYVLKRLVRSLGANVSDVRTGYFATLVGLLTKFDQITASQLLELIKKELHASGSSKSVSL